jgi:PAN domain
MVRNYLLAGLLIGAGIALASTQSGAQTRLYPNYDLRSDHDTRFSLPRDRATPENCLRACRSDTRCRGFTYNPREAENCSLTYQLWQGKPDPCCIGGIVR